MQGDRQDIVANIGGNVSICNLSHEELDFPEEVEKQRKMCKFLNYKIFFSSSTLFRSEMLNCLLVFSVKK